MAFCSLLCVQCQMFTSVSGEKESLSDHGPFTLIQQQHLPRLKVRANWHIACAPSVHLGSLALPYRCEGVHVGSSVLVCACPCLTTFGWGSCRAPLCKKSASVSSVLSARSKSSCWHRRSDASSWPAATAAADLGKSFHLGEDARPRSAVLCQEADVLSKQDISGVADAEICGFFAPGGVSFPVTAQVHSWKTTPGTLDLYRMANYHRSCMSL